MYGPNGTLNMKWKNEMSKIIFHQVSTQQYHTTGCTASSNQPYSQTDLVPDDEKEIVYYRGIYLVILLLF